MPIIYASNSSREDSRKQVLEFLKQKKAEDPNYLVLDIGGSANSWADAYVDAYVDIVEADSKKPTFVGDINDFEVWEGIRQQGPVDFLLCTHTLEDIRDPVFVIRQIQKTAKAGYISMPNKYAEMSHVESHYFTGWSHHRWIFRLIKDLRGQWVVEFIPKYASANYYSAYNHSPWVKIKRLFRLTNKDQRDRPSWNLPAVKRHRSIANLKNELGFIWENDFEFKYTDYFPSTRHILESLREFTEQGL